MSNILFFIICTLNATAISIVDADAFTHWQAWVSIGCVSCAYLCGATKNRKKSNA